jgi:uroporphyrinogen decarboxylase
MRWTPRERVLAALEHEQADRPPIDFGGVEFTSIATPAYDRLKAYLGLTHKTELMSLIHAVARPDEAILRRFDVDTRGVVLGAYEGGMQKLVDENCVIDIFGITWKRTGDTDVSPMMFVDGPFHDIAPSIEAVESFDWPDPDNPGLVRGVREQVEAIKKSGDYAICLYLPGGVFLRGCGMRGFESYLKDLYRNREFLSRLLDKLEAFWARLAENALRAAGPENIDVVYFAEDLATQDGCLFDPDEIYAKVLKPRHRHLVEVVKSLSKAKIGFHCCGSAYPFIEHLIDIGVDALNPVQVSSKNMEPERLKEEFGDRLTFWGGVDSQRVLPSGSPEEVAAETRRIIDILGRGGGFVLNSVHNIQAEVPPQNVVAMFDAGRAYRYPSAA